MGVRTVAERAGGGTWRGLATAGRCQVEARQPHSNIGTRSRSLLKLCALQRRLARLLLRGRHLSSGGPRGSPPRGQARAGVLRQQRVGQARQVAKRVLQNTTAPQSASWDCEPLFACNELAKTNPQGLHERRVCFNGPF